MLDSASISQVTTIAIQIAAQQAAKTQPAITQIVVALITPLIAGFSGWLAHMHFGKKS